MENVWLNPQFFNTKPTTAIFADRDGTLIRHVDYVHNPEQIELLPGVKDTVHQLIEKSVPFFILTNQSGVGRGYFPIEKVHACQDRLFELLDIKPTDIAGWCIAPRGPESEGGYRKPSPRFISEACQHLGIAPSETHMIGDTLVDLETAWATGAHPWAVACGKPQLPTKIANHEIDQKHTLKDDFTSCVFSIL